MKKVIGPLKAGSPVIIINTDPPYKPWDGNQATYLFFPVFVSLILTLIGTLSAPLIPGLSTVDVHSKYGEGVVKLGMWGMCIENFPHSVAKCVPYSIFGNNTQAMADLPTGVLTMGLTPSAVDDSYKIANGIMHVLACVVSWAAVTLTLAASGEYERKGGQAWNWTQWAWRSNTACLIMGIIPFALDIALIPKTAAIVKLVDGSAGKVTPGATIYMSAAATTLNLITLFVRYLWSRRQPRPSWTSGDYHVNPLHPAADANKDLPAVPVAESAGAEQHDDDKPPSWESLNFNSTHHANDDKAEWSRADDALETIDEKRASLVRDGYAV